MASFRFRWAIECFLLHLRAGLERVAADKNALVQGLVRIVDGWLPSGEDPAQSASAGPVLAFSWPSTTPVRGL